MCVSVHMGVSRYVYRSVYVCVSMLTHVHKDVQVCAYVFRNQEKILGIFPLLISSLFSYLKERVSHIGRSTFGQSFGQAPPRIFVSAL